MHCDFLCVAAATRSACFAFGVNEPSRSALAVAAAMAAMKEDLKLLLRRSGVHDDVRAWLAASPQDCHEMKIFANIVDDATQLKASVLSHTNQKDSFGQLAWTEAWAGHRRARFGRAVRRRDPPVEVHRVPELLPVDTEGTRHGLQLTPRKACSGV